MTASAATWGLPQLPVPTPEDKRQLPLLPIEALLKAQRKMTAVERFSEHHDARATDEANEVYRDLIPLERPRPGEQYAFEVDLDACTGCKACVAGCHTLNGLDETELWRTVGLLHGGTTTSPAVQTVTTACHHCLDPACLSGCPVQAYEKDPITGIVKHLDDQCIGCQYCTLMCPYDAPKYNKARGIVRKCDMCSDRLANDEAPACVQSCPNEAISIRIVSREGLVEAGNARAFVPGAPAPEHTLPSTSYKTNRAMPLNMLPADFYRTHSEHSHPPLVVMLTLTQLSVGTFGFGYITESLLGRPLGSPIGQAGFACGIALVALAASVFHLGRPWLAWRAVLGLRTSWLSREALAFGVFAQLALMHGLLAAAPLFPAFPLRREIASMAGAAQASAALSGVIGVFCSVMVYVATRRVQWSGVQTGLRFFGSTVALGAAAMVTIATLTTDTIDPTCRALLWLVIATTGMKLLFEGSALLSVRDPQLSIQKRMAIVMLGDLAATTAIRFAFACVGGVMLPLSLLRDVWSASATGYASTFALLVLLIGEFAERRLFFAAAPASHMPGALR